MKEPNRFSPGIDYSGEVFSQQIQEDDLLSNYHKEIQDLCISSPAKNSSEFSKRISRVKEIISDAETKGVRFFERNPNDKNRNIFHYFSLIFKDPLAEEDKKYIELLVKKAVDDNFDFFSRTLGQGAMPLDPLQYAVMKCNRDFSKLLVHQLLNYDVKNIKKLLDSMVNFCQMYKDTADQNLNQILSVCMEIIFLLIDEVVKKNASDFSIEEGLIDLILSAIQQAINSEKLDELEMRYNEHGDTLLLSSAYRCCSLKIIKIFLEKFNVENGRNNKFDSNFLHQLLRGRGRVEDKIKIFNLLLSGNPGLEVVRRMFKVKDKRGNTPLVYAIGDEGAEIIKRIISIFPDILYDSLNREEDNLLFLVLRGDKQEGNDRNKRKIKRETRDELIEAILDAFDSEEHWKKHLNEPRGKDRITAYGLAKEQGVAIERYQKKAGKNKRTPQYYVDRQEYEEIESDFKRARTDLGRIRQERDDLKRSHEEDQQSLARLRAERDIFRKDCKAWEQELARAHQKYAELERRYEQGQESLTKIRGQHDEFKRQHTRVQASLTEISQEFSSSHATVQESLTKLHEGFRKYREETQKELIETREGYNLERTEKERIINDLSKKIEILQAESSKALQEKDEVLAERAQEIKSLSQERDRLREEVQEEKNKNANLEPLKRNLEDTVGELKRKLSTSERELEFSKRARTTVDQENNRLKTIETQLQLFKSFLSSSQDNPDAAEHSVDSADLKKNTEDDVELISDLEEEPNLFKSYEAVPNKKELTGEAKKHIGRKGEEHAYKMLLSHYKLKFSTEKFDETTEGFKIAGQSKKGIGKEVEVIWKNKVTDTKAPIDIIKKITYSDGREKVKYMEIKSTTCSEKEKGVAEITRNQLKYMIKYRGNFSIFRIYDALTEAPSERIFKDPYQTIFAQSIKFPKSIQSLKIKI